MQLQGREYSLVEEQGQEGRQVEVVGKSFGRGF